MAANTNLVPQIDSVALPTTPVREWANETSEALTAEAAAAAKEQRPPTSEEEERHPSIPHFASTAETPGPSVPGAFPKDAINDGETPVETKDRLSDMMDAARSYMPAQEDVGKAITDMGQTVKSYIPDSVAPYLNLAPSTAKSTEHPTSLPSTEVHGDASGKSGGVGSLPGTINEESVAKLPEERAADGTLRDTTEVGSEKKPIQTTTNQLTTENKSTLPSTVPQPPAVQPGVGGVGDLPGAASESAVALLPEERKLDETTTNLSANHKQSSFTAPGAGGVGDLPGASSERGIALLPEERKIGDQTNSGFIPDRHSERFSDLNKSGVGGVGDLPGPPSETAVTLLPEERKTAEEKSSINIPDRPSHNHLSALSTTAVAGHVPTSDTTHSTSKSRDPLKDSASIDHLKPITAAPAPPVPAKDKGYSPSAAASTKAIVDEPGVVSENKDAKTTPDSKFSDTHSEKSASSASASADGKTKASFMSKMKGEAKIISGKLGKNEEKIEEGKRLAGKA